MSKPVVVYIAGPYRGPNAYRIEQNIRRAEELALQVWALTVDPDVHRCVAALCPHANTRFFQRALPDHVWLDGDLELLRRCDAVVLAEGWQDSVGTCAEIKHALDCGVPVFKSVEEVRAWLIASAGRS